MDFVFQSILVTSLFSSVHCQTLADPLPVIQRLTWTEEDKLTALDAAENDEFGWAVDLDNDTAIVGAYRADPLGDQSGAAYIFVRTESGWTQQAKLVPDDATPPDWFGYSVAIHGDTAIVGAIFMNPLGAAYVFVRNGTTWSQQAKLTAAGNGGFFGWSVSVDGDTVVVGAPLYSGQFLNQGRVFVFQRSNGIWTQRANLVAPDGAETDYLGSSVAIDAGTIIAGAPYADVNAIAQSGAAYVYVKPTTNWLFQAKLTPSNPILDEQFGYSVALEHDTAVIGAPHNAASAGAAYVFTQIANAWTQQTRLFSSDGMPDDRFGTAVGICDSHLAVTAAGTGDWQGAAYAFSHCTGPWLETAKLVASDAAPGDNFGEFSIGVSAGRVIVGAPIKDGPAGERQGTAYVFPVETLPADALPVGLVDSPICSGAIVGVTVDATQAGVAYQLLADSTPTGSAIEGNSAQIILAGPVTASVSQEVTLSVRATNVVSGCTTLLQTTRDVFVWSSGNGDGNNDGLSNGLDIHSFLNVVLDSPAPSEPVCAYDMNADGAVDLDDVDPFVVALINAMD
jgi:hypothetical protein